MGSQAPKSGVQAYGGSISILTIFLIKSMANKGRRILGHLRHFSFFTLLRLRATLCQLSACRLNISSSSASAVWTQLPCLLQFTTFLRQVGIYLHFKISCFKTRQNIYIDGMRRQAKANMKINYHFGFSICPHEFEKKRILGGAAMKCLEIGHHLIIFGFAGADGCASTKSQKATKYEEGAKASPFPDSTSKS